MAPPNEPATNEEVERIDDPDLEASLDEPATEDGEEVMDAIDDMIRARVRHGAQRPMTRG
jgi:hypothetical protein